MGKIKRSESALASLSFKGEFYLKKIFYLFLIAAIIGNGFLTTKTVSANNETDLVSDTSISEVRQVEELKVSTVKYDTDMNCIIRVASNSDSVETTYVPIVNIENISTSDSDVQKIIPYIAET